MMFPLRSRSLNQLHSAILLTVGGGLLLYFVQVNGRLSIAGDLPKAADKMNDLAIQLRLSQDQYNSTDKMSVEIVFHNKGKTELKLALADDEFNNLFFDFLVLGDKGTQYMTRNAGNWMNPIDKGVKLVRIRPGGTYSLKLKDAINLRNVGNAGVFVNESYMVLAIFRDYSNGDAAASKDPAVWRGMVLSLPATIKRITYIEEKKKNRGEP